MRITPLDLEVLSEDEFDDLQEWVEDEKNHRRIASYPDEFARIVGEGVLGTDTKPLYDLLDEYAKIVGKYNRFACIRDVERGRNYYTSEPMLIVTYADGAEHYDYSVTLEDLKNPDSVRQKMAQNQENTRRQEIADLEAKLARLKGGTP